MAPDGSLPSRLLRFSQTPYGGFTVGLLVFLASLANFLTFSSYPAFRLEVGLVVLLLAAVAALAALAFRAAGRLGRLVLVALLVFLAFDLNSRSQYDILVAAVALLMLRDYSLPILGVMACTVLLSKSALLVGDHDMTSAAHAIEASESAAPLAGSGDQPALLHLMLDAHIGVEASAGEGAGLTQTGDAIRQFYDRNGFRLFGGAYSIHRRTLNSMQAVLNGNRDVPLYGNVLGLHLDTNRYFDVLAERGYRINVLQTDWIDYCAGKGVVSCREWKSADPRPLLAAPLTVSEKATVLTAQFFSLSRIVSGSAALYDDLAAAAQARGVPLPPLLLEDKSLTSTLVAASEFDALIDNLRTVEPGTAYFAHILLPHQPFALDRNCAVRPLREWQVQVSDFAPVAERKAAYLEQVLCTQKKIQAALDALAASPAGGNTIVVIHGDHGSRITAHEPFVDNDGRFTDQDVVDSYSTLFAVRAPGMEAGYDSRRLPIHLILSGLAASGFTGVAADVAPDFRHTIVMENEDWVPVEVRDLPETWTGR